LEGVSRMAKFETGQIVITRGAEETLYPLSVTMALAAYLAGDWGELAPEDKQANETALRDSSRLLGAYRDRFGTKFWIITEADRSVTTILLPEEY
jgi:hypothetical protein